MSDCCDKSLDSYAVIQAWIVPDEDTREPSIWIAQREVYLPPVQGIQLKFQIVPNGYDSWKFPSDDWNGFCKGLKMKRKKDNEFLDHKNEKWPFKVTRCRCGLCLCVDDNDYDGRGYDFKLLLVTKEGSKIASKDPSIRNRSDV